MGKEFDRTERPEMSDKPERAEKSDRTERPKQTNKEQRQLRCFTCNKPGHKASECPDRKANCRKIEIPETDVSMLQQNETMVSIDGELVPMTMDTGASFSLVPRELIPASCLTGRKQKYIGVDKNKGSSEGEIANVSMTIRDIAKTVEVTAVPGEHLGWVTALKLSVTEPEDQQLLLKLGNHRANMCEEVASSTGDVV